MVYAGALALFLADRLSWRVVYLVMALGLLPGAVASLPGPGPDGPAAPPGPSGRPSPEPFLEFLRRAGPGGAGLHPALQAGRQPVRGPEHPFLLGLGFSKTEIGLATKIVGMACLIGGGLVGGLLMAPLEPARSLWVFGVLQMVCMAGHVALALAGQEPRPAAGDHGGGELHLRHGRASPTWP